MTCQVSSKNCLRHAKLADGIQKEKEAKGWCLALGLALAKHGHGRGV